MAGEEDEEEDSVVTILSWAVVVAGLGAAALGYLTFSA
jgi:hypothetical protein